MHGVRATNKFFEYSGICGIMGEKDRIFYLILMSKR